jgi:hypothetical protein
MLLASVDPLVCLRNQFTARTIESAMGHHLTTQRKMLFQENINVIYLKSPSPLQT